MLVMLAALSIAEASDVALTRSSGPPLHVFVDGEYRGKLGKKDPLTVSVADGVHEIFLAPDPSTLVAVCFGTIDVRGAFAVDVPEGTPCGSLTPGAGPISALDGAYLSVSGVRNSETVSVFVDGRTASLGRLNLAPGTHTVVIGVGLSAVICAGKVTLDPGETSMFTVAGTLATEFGTVFHGRCTGFDDEIYVQD